MCRMEVALLLPCWWRAVLAPLSPTPSQSLQPYRAQLSMQKQTGNLVGLGHDSDTTPPRGFQGPQMRQMLRQGSCCKMKTTVRPVR